MSDVYYTAPADWASTLGPSGIPRISIPLNPTLGALTQANDELLRRYGDAIASVESGGKYDAIGPETKAGDRAYGRYQVMGANIPQWTQEALGRSLTPEEFLADHKAQDTVFRHRFGGYLSRFGTPVDAASAWFTGGPISSANSAKHDVLGTSGSGYVDKFLSALAGAGSPGLDSNPLLHPQELPAARMTNALFGLNGAERYQLWPERLMRSALSAPQDAMAGKLGAPGTREFSSAAIPRALDMASVPSVGLVNPELGAAGMLGGKLTSVRGPAEPAPVFYSTAEQTIRNAGFSKASPQQWLAYLRNAQGVKGEELEWSGLGDLLSNSTEPQVTREQLLSHLGENGVELNEITHGQDQFAPLKQERRRLLDLADDASANGLRLSDEQNARLQELNRAISPEYGTIPAQPKYSNYTLPGAEPGSYREALLTLPQAGTRSGGGVLATEGPFAGVEAAPNPEPAYRSSHWDEPNVLAHVRMNDREVRVPGADRPLKTLFLEEFQSDWHQQGRKFGYKQPPKLDWKPHAGVEKDQFYTSIGDTGHVAQLGKLPSGKWAAVTPYGSEILPTKEAAQNWVASNVVQHSDGVPNAPFRSSWPELLLKRMIREAAEGGYDALAWTPGEVQAARYDLSKQLSRVTYRDRVSGEKGGTLVAYDHNGKEVLSQPVDDPKELVNYVGKDVADKLLQAEPTPAENGVFQTRQLGGLDLRVGGEGMLKFYDDMLPNVANKLAKRFGGKGDRVEIGQTRTIDKRDILDEDLNPGKSDLAPVHVLKISPELRKHALSQGFPLFSAGVPLSVLGEGGQRKTLTPVDYDPFSPEGLNKGDSL